MAEDAFFIVDVSQWDDDINWNVLAHHNVVSAVVKATGGNYSVDPKFRQHVAAAKAAGLVVGAYHWADPNCNDNSQAQFFLDTIAGQPIHYLAIDVEQEWADWREWQKLRTGDLSSLSRYVAPDRISANALNIARHVQGKSGLPVIIYTRASFIDTYARPAQSWLPTFDLWIANYRYKDADALKKSKIRTTWEEMAEHYMPDPSQHPALPKGVSKWKFWQFSGELFVLEGTGETKIDINLFNGSKADFYAWARASAPAAPADPPPADPNPQPVSRDPALPHAVRILLSQGLPVRSTTSMEEAVVVDFLPANMTPTIFEVRVVADPKGGLVKYGRIGTDRWIVMHNKNGAAAAWL